jgi:hypothetical protein
MAPKANAAWLQRRGYSAAAKAVPAAPARKRQVSLLQEEKKVSARSITTFLEAPVVFDVDDETETELVKTTVQQLHAAELVDFDAHKNLRSALARLLWALTPGVSGVIVESELVMGPGLEIYVHHALSREEEDFVRDRGMVSFFDEDSCGRWVWVSIAQEVEDGPLTMRYKVVDAEGDEDRIQERNFFDYR